MSNLNKVMVTGNVGADATLRQTRNGYLVTNITLAVQGFGQKVPTWMKIRLWNDLAEFVTAQVGKGSYILVEGELAQNTWQDQEGLTRTEVIIEARRVEVISFKAPHTPTRFDEAGDAREEEVEEVQFAQAPALSQEPVIEQTAETQTKPTRKRTPRKRSAQEASAAQ